MSRLWDTPEFWVRTEVDDMLRDFKVLTADTLADRLEHSRVRRYSDPDFVRQIIIELRKRAYSRVRFWPEPCDRTDARADADRSADAADNRQLAVMDDEGFWWQRY